MQDQHFIRDWTEVHEDFTADLQQTLNQLGRRRWARETESSIIGSPYDRILDRRRVEPPRRGLSPAAQASLRGLASDPRQTIGQAPLQMILHAAQVRDAGVQPLRSGVRPRRERCAHSQG